MAQKTRAQILAEVIAKILTGGSRTTAANLRDVLLSLNDSVQNILDDKDQPGGYAGLDINGLINPAQLPAQNPIVSATLDITGLTTLDLSAYSGFTLLTLTSSNPAENILNIVNYSRIDTVWLCPSMSFDLSIVDGGNIRLFAPTLTCYGAKEGFIQLLKRGSVPKLYQLTYIDQYV